MFVSVGTNVNVVEEVRPTALLMRGVLGELVTAEPQERSVCTFPYEPKEVIVLVLNALSVVVIVIGSTGGARGGDSLALEGPEGALVPS